jgi:hypothetical protein
MHKLCARNDNITIIIILIESFTYNADSLKIQAFISKLSQIFDKTDQDMTINVYCSNFYDHYIFTL